MDSLRRESCVLSRFVAAARVTCLMSGFFFPKMRHLLELIGVMVMPGSEIATCLLRELNLSHFIAWHLASPTSPSGWAHMDASNCCSIKKAIMNLGAPQRVTYTNTTIMGESKTKNSWESNTLKREKKVVQVWDCSIM